MEGSVVCAECYAQVGYDGAQRGVLLLPCQHMMHASCEEYCRKIRALRKVMNGQSERRETLQLRCPACQTIVERVIPLFLNPLPTENAQTSDNNRESSQQRNQKRQRSRSCETSQPPLEEGENGGDDEGDDGKGPNHHDRARGAYKAQHTYLTQVRRLWKERERSSDLWRACADYHQRKEEAQQCIEELGKLLPASSTLSSSSGSTGSKPADLASTLDYQVEYMSLTELEMYLTHTFPQLDRLVSENRTLRHAKERKQKRLAEVQQKYANEKKNLRAIGGGSNRSIPGERTRDAEGVQSSTSRRENGCTPLFVALRHSNASSSTGGTRATTVVPPSQTDTQTDAIGASGNAPLTSLTEQPVESSTRERGRPLVVIDVDDEDSDVNEMNSEEDFTSFVNQPSLEGNRAQKNDATISQVDERGWFSPMTDLRHDEFPASPSGALIEVISDVDDGDRLDTAIDVDDDDDDGEDDDPRIKREQLRSSMGETLSVSQLSGQSATLPQPGESTGETEEDSRGQAEGEEEEVGESSAGSVPSYFFPRSVSYPVMGRSVKRSMRDLPRREDALWQPSIERFR